MAIIGAFMVPHPPLIVAEVGNGKEKEIAHTIAAYEEVAKRIAELKPETIVVTTPHSIMYSDYFHISPGTHARGDFAQFGAKKVAMEVRYDTAFVKELSDLARQQDLMAGTLGEREKSLDHGTMVPLYFINKLYQDYELVRIGLSGQALIEHYKLGTCIKEAADRLGRKTVFVASGDLSHCLKKDGPYGYKPEGPMYDEQIMEVMAKAEFLKLFAFKEEFCEKASECGHRSFVIMAGALDRMKVRPERISYEGPFGVGYGVCAYEVIGEDKSRDFLEQYEDEKREKLAEIRSREDAYVKLARASLESYFYQGKVSASSEEISEEMIETRAGAFVSLKKDGRLRGCIGTILPTRETLAEEIMMNAVSAAVNDPRFEPVTKKELSDLVISVDVLGEPEKIMSESQLDPKRYGVIVTRGHKRGLLLPNLEGIDSVKVQIEIAKQKAGIKQEEEVQLERFEVVRHK